MFPESFAEHQIALFTEPGDLVLDPFSGRGTTVFQALMMGRAAAATDINPVAYCISRAKGTPPTEDVALYRISELRRVWSSQDHASLASERRELPTFFGRAFFWTTLEQLLFLRRALRWEDDALDCFIAALCLGSLHGDRDKSPHYFSNQMPRTISPKPAYSLRFWRERDLWPHKRDVFKILQQRVSFRLAKGVPTGEGVVKRCDVRDAAQQLPEHRGLVRLVCTSPPYFNVTDYEEDQWLRLWFLGGAPHPTYQQVSTDDRHTRKHEYWRFLSEAWQGIAPLVKDGAVLACRMGGKEMDRDELLAGLLRSIRKAFPAAFLISPPEQTVLTGRQTDAFRPGSRGCEYEWDFHVRLGS